MSMDQFLTIHVSESHQNTTPEITLEFLDGITSLHSGKKRLDEPREILFKGLRSKVLVCV